jgi:hypothetical protein
MPADGYELLEAEGIFSFQNMGWVVDSRADGADPSSYAWMDAQGTAPIELMMELNRTNHDMRWSLGKFTNDFTPKPTLPIQDDDHAYALQISLANALPAPAPGTSPEQILKLRVRRRPELLAFRAALDDLYLAIEKSDQKELALIRAKEKIEASLLALERVLDESKLRRVATTVKAYLSLKEIDATSVLMPAAGAMVSGGTGSSPAWGALAGLGANAALKFASEFRKPRDLPVELRDYAYLYYVSSL